MRSSFQPASWFKAIAGAGAVIAVGVVALSWLEHKFSVMAAPEPVGAHDAFMADIRTAIVILLGSIALGQVATLLASRRHKGTATDYWGEQYRNEIRNRR